MITYLKDEQIQGRKKAPLWYHTRGLMQTVTGYGRKLTTPHMLKVNNRWRRVYVHCFSNCGTAYINLSGHDVIVNDWQVKGD